MLTDIVVFTGLFIIGLLVLYPFVWYFWKYRHKKLNRNVPTELIRKEVELNDKPRITRLTRKDFDLGGNSETAEDDGGDERREAVQILPSKRISTHKRKSKKNWPNFSDGF